MLVCSSDESAAGVITLVLLLLLSLRGAPVDGEKALVEEVFVVEADSTWIILSLGVVGDELQVLPDSNTEFASTWVVCALRAAGVEPAGMCCRFPPPSVGSEADPTFRRMSSDAPFSLPISFTEPTDCDAAGVP